MDALYKVTVAGELDACWARALGLPLRLRAEEGRTLLLVGPVDQGELLGLLAALDEANLPILDLARLYGAGEAGDADGAR